VIHVPEFMVDHVASPVTTELPENGGILCSGIRGVLLETTLFRQRGSGMPALCETIRPSNDHCLLSHKFLSKDN
jgi:hypothetical protein